MVENPNFSFDSPPTLGVTYIPVDLFIEVYSSRGYPEQMHLLHCLHCLRANRSGSKGLADTTTCFANVPELHQRS
ncbi:MAG: hypothetical protein ACE361_12950 [Aureliella sp.]